MPDDRFEFARVVFFGRGLSEYVDMFDLALDELKGKRVLDCAAGPAAFATEAAEHGIEVVACDPMYEHEAVMLRSTVDADAKSVAAKQAANPDALHKGYMPTDSRRQQMEVFLNDYLNGKANGRYVPGKLPTLPFADESFDVVLSANLLFIYSDIPSGGMLENSPLDLEFHRSSILEMIRIASNELRIYPLQGAHAKGHKYLPRIIDDCKKLGHKATVCPVKQRDLVGAENMLRIVKNVS